MGAYHQKKNRYLEGAYRDSPQAFRPRLKSNPCQGLPLMINEVLWAAGMTDQSTSAIPSAALLL